MFILVLGLLSTFTNIRISKLYKKIAEPTTGLYQYQKKCSNDAKPFLSPHLECS